MSAIIANRTFAFRSVLGSIFQSKSKFSLCASCGSNWNKVSKPFAVSNGHGNRAFGSKTAEEARTTALAEDAIISEGMESAQRIRLQQRLQNIAC